MDFSLIRKYIVYVILLLPNLSVANRSIIEEQKNAAIQLVRAGEVELGYQQLVLLHEANLDNQAIIYDLVEVAARAGYPEKSLVYGQKITSLANAPIYALEYLGKISRQLGDYAISYKYYELLYQKQAKADYLLGQALAQTLAKQDGLVRQTINKLQNIFPNSVEYFLAEGFYQEQNQHFSEAEKYYAKGLEYHPNNKQLRRADILALKSMGAISVAKKQMTTYPDLFSENEKLALDNAELANQIRWMDVEELDVFQTLEKRKQLIFDIESRLIENPNNTRLKFDAIIAYKKANQPRKALQLYYELLANQSDIPDYVKLSAARAYLDDHQPEMSIALFNEIYQQQKIPLSDKMYLYYAYSDLRDFRIAEKLLAEMIADNPPILAAKTPVAKVNSERLYLEAQQISLEVAKDNLVDAHDKSQQLIDKAPLNVAIRNTHAGVQAARGWHEQAEKNYEVSHNLDASGISTLLDMIGNEMNLGQYEKAAEKLKFLEKIQPDNSRVQRSKEDWQRRTGWSLYSSNYYSENKDSIFGSNEFISETKLTGPMLNHTWRPIFGYDYSRAKIDGEYEHYNRIYAGIEYQKDKNAIDITVGESRDNRLNIGVDYARRLNDHWRISTGYEANALIPLKAIRDNVSGDRAYASLLYRDSELWDIYANTTYYHFDDGNDRYELGVSGRRQIYNQPNFKVDATGGIGLSKNKEIDEASYYNPKESASVDIGLKSRWLTYARYDMRFEQVLSFGAGVQYQKYYGNDPIGQVRYSHDWQLNKDFSMSYGVDWKTRVYDGDREDPYGFSLEFNWYLN